jgi:hypothetical protein
MHIERENFSHRDQEPAVNEHLNLVHLTKQERKDYKHPPGHERRQNAEAERATSTASRPAGAESQDAAKTTANILGGIFRNPLELRNFWVAQPHNFDCGPSALAEAIRDIRHLGQFTIEQINKLSKETGTEPSLYNKRHKKIREGGFPWGDGQHMEEAARKQGLDAQTFRFKYDAPGIMTQLDSEFEKGHRAIAFGPGPDLNDPYHNGGHFVYIAGKVDDDHYLIGNPANPTFGPDGGSYKNRIGPPMTGKEDGKRVVSRKALESWLRGRTTRGDVEFTAVWAKQ